MKIQLIPIVALVSMSSFSGDAKGSETVISSVPFTISTSGTYILSGNLDYAGQNAAITVEASNVVIDLKGFTLSTSNPNSFGIAADAENFAIQDVAIQNGEITGFRTGLSLGGVLNVARNLKVFGCKFGISLDPGPFGFCEIQDCLIAGNGASDGGTGVILSSGRNVVQDCQILDYLDGARSAAGKNTFIANSIFSCTTGLMMEKSDKYQGNVTNGCTTPFSGGTAVGDENN